MLTFTKKYGTSAVPPGLRQWFIIHFIVDVIVAIPLFFMTETILTTIGWPGIDPFATRLLAAALFGIGTESFLVRNGSIELFHGMLNLKIIWSSFAVAGITVTMITEPEYLNALAWATLFTFLFFLLLWSYWKLYLLRKN